MSRYPMNLVIAISPFAISAAMTTDLLDAIGVLVLYSLGIKINSFFCWF